ncbi:T9SS type A sorting domain-containing protein [Candidatus Fermentibacteria bacterium]|nr:T9SS type A sorting domain-containing protein [Candidatus Fermentibacteria bacterium]
MTVSVAGTMLTNLSLVAAPVPAMDGGTLLLRVPQDQRVSVGLYDLTGRLAMTMFEGELTSGAHSLSWVRGDLASGTYFARAHTATGWVTSAVILK